jgi:hypothetical protein
MRTTHTVILTTNLKFFQVISHIPEERFEVGAPEMTSVLRTVVLVDKPALDAGGAVDMFAGSLDGVFQDITTNTTQKTVIYCFHKSIDVVPH